MPRLLLKNTRALSDRLRTREIHYEQREGFAFHMKNGGTFKVRYHNSDVLLALLILVSIATSFRVDAQNGAIMGTVLDPDTELGLAYANITLIGNGQDHSADSAGSFKIDALSPGAYSIRVAYLGYGDTTVTGITVSAGTVTEILVQIPACPFAVLGKERKCPVCGREDTVIDIHYCHASGRDKRKAARGTIHLVEGERPRCAPTYRCQSDGTEF